MLETIYNIILLFIAVFGTIAITMFVCAEQTAKNYEFYRNRSKNKKDFDEYISYGISPREAYILSKKIDRKQDRDND